MENIKAFVQKYAFFFLITIITCAATLRIYYAYQKEAFNINEISVFKKINATSNLGDVTFDQKDKNKWTDGKEYIDDYFTLHKKNLKEDIQLLLRNTKDRPHPNLYFVALRLALSNGIRGVDGLYKFYGIGLNIFFYCIGAFFLYLLYNNIYKNEIYALLAVFLYSISIGAISTSIFIRNYALLSLFIIITTFIVFNILDKEKPSLLDFIILSLTSTLGYLSHYYFIVFVFILTFLILYHYLNNKHLKLIPCYVIAFVQGFINAQAFYPQFIGGYLPSSFRAKEAYSKLDMTFLIDQLTTKLESTYNIINKNIIYFLPLVVLSIIILVGYSLFKKNKTIVIPKEIYLTFVSLILSFLLIYISPYGAPRYLFGIFPILIVLLIVFIRLIPVRNLKYLMVTLLCIIYIIKGLDVSNNGYVYRGFQNKLIFREKPNIPVYFINSTWWAHMYLSAYFVEGQKYKMILDEVPVLDFNETESKEIFLIVEGNSKTDIVKKQIKKEKWIIKKEVNYRTHYNILEIEKSNSILWNPIS
jgi:hypothetical protein